MNIGFYTAGVPFEGDALEKGALGGSETAFIQVTRALNALGHQVTVFNSCRKPGLYHGVHYYSLLEALPILAQQSFDVFVVSRFFGFFNLPIKASLKVLWNHDTLDNPKDLRMLHDEIDLFLVLSVFHKDNFLIRLPQLDDRLVVTRNGLDFELMDRAAAETKVDPHKLLYASRPERGLKVLLEDIWPRLYRSNPKLKLHLCGYNVDRAGLSPKLLELYDHLEHLAARTPGLVSLGNLNKIDYYRHLAETNLVLYPSTFPEVSCLVALEAQALGTPILTSDSFALSESVVLPQMKICGRPGSALYNQDYVERALTLLAKPDLLKELGQEAKAAIRRRYGWATVAAEWIKLFDLSLRAKNAPNGLVEIPAATRAELV